MSDERQIRSIAYYLILAGSLRRSPDHRPLGQLQRPPQRTPSTVLGACDPQPGTDRRTG